MNEDQANAMLDLLESINNKLELIENNTSKINSDAYDLGDVCSRIDDVISSMP